ncbi:MAG: hypothetical protein O8C63_08720 [Candidatus Methanoperedens sp.]|nr:hypothetical protein [Candidatus Methanoperedens sp.]
MKKYLFLCIIALFVVSGCVDKIQTQIQAEKTGWDQAKYEEYSKYFDHVMDNQRVPSLAQSLEFEVKDKLYGMRSDGSEFERTWFLAFSNLQSGLELKARAYSFTCYPMKVGEKPDGANIASCYNGNKALLESKPYFNKSLEYRQKIEEMKPK